MKTVKDYEYSYNHVRQRLMERYNIEEFSIRDYNHMNDIIRIYRKYNEICNGDNKRHQHHVPLWTDNNGDQEAWQYLNYKVVFSISKDRVTTVIL